MVEKKVEVEKIVEVESPHQKKKIEQLKKIIKHLEQQLAKPKSIKATYQSNNQTLPTRIYAERVIIYSLLAIILLIWGKNLTRKITKKKHKKS